MIPKPDQQRVKNQLTEAILTVLNRNNLLCKFEFCVEGLLGITLDSHDIFLLNIKETIRSPNLVGCSPPSKDHSMNPLDLMCLNSLGPSIGEVEDLTVKHTSITSTPGKRNTSYCPLTGVDIGMKGDLGFNFALNYTLDSIVEDLSQGGKQIDGFSMLDNDMAMMMDKEILPDLPAQKCADKVSTMKAAGMDLDFEEQEQTLDLSIQEDEVLASITSSKPATPDIEEGMPLNLSEPKKKRMNKKKVECNSCHKLYVSEASLSKHKCKAASETITQPLDLTVGGDEKGKLIIVVPEAQTSQASSTGTTTTTTTTPTTASDTAAVALLPDTDKTTTSQAEDEQCAILHINNNIHQYHYQQHNDDTTCNTNNDLNTTDTPKDPNDNDHNLELNNTITNGHDPDDEDDEEDQVQGESFTCICGKAVPDYAAYIQHSAGCARAKLTPYKSCETCHKVFFSNSGYLKHQRLHVGAYKLRCKHCQKGFFDSTHLNAHIDARHSHVRRYACPRCDKGFFWKHHLKRHLHSCGGGGNASTASQGDRGTTEGGTEDNSAQLACVMIPDILQQQQQPQPQPPHKRQRLSQQQQQQRKQQRLLKQQQRSENLGHRSASLSSPEEVESLDMDTDDLANSPGDDSTTLQCQWTCNLKTQ